MKDWMLFNQIGNREGTSALSISIPHYTADSSTCNMATRGNKRHTDWK